MTNDGWVSVWVTAEVSYAAMAAIWAAMPLAGRRAARESRTMASKAAGWSAIHRSVRLRDMILAT